MNYHENGHRIRKPRKAHGPSQEALAEKVNISTVHMSHIEASNTKLCLPVFVDLAAALEIRTDGLLYDVESAARSASIEVIIRLLDTCTTRQIEIIEDILRATEVMLNKHL